jgi:hypothetical protein
MHIAVPAPAGFNNAANLTVSLLLSLFEWRAQPVLRMFVGSLQLVSACPSRLLPLICRTKQPVDKVMRRGNSGSVTRVRFGLSTASKGVSCCCLQACPGSNTMLPGWPGGLLACLHSFESGARM